MNHPLTKHHRLLGHLDLIFGDPLASPLILAGGHGDRDLILWLDGLLGKPGNIGFLDLWTILEDLNMVFLMS